MRLTDVDALSLLINLLNNALESCKKIQPPDERWIEVVIQCRTPYLCMLVLNSLCRVALPMGELVTGKTDMTLHGYGIPIVQSVVWKYDGFAPFECSEDSFVAEAALRVVAESG